MHVTDGMVCKMVWSLNSLFYGQVTVLEIDKYVCTFDGLVVGDAVVSG